MKIKSILNNPWVFKSGTTVLAGIALRIIDLIFGLSIFDFFFKLINFKFNIPLWLFLIIISIILIITFLFFKKRNNKIKMNNSNQCLPFLLYTEDFFNGVIYKWEYISNLSNKYEIDNINSFCPKCNCQLISDKCPNCNSDYYFYKKTYDEKSALIRHRILNKFKN